MDLQMVLFEMKTWDHVVAAIICVIAPILAITTRKIAVEDVKLEPAEKIRLYHSNALLLIVFALVITTTWRIPGRPVSALGLTWPVWHPYVTILLIAIVLFYVLDIFFQYGTRKWRERTFRNKNKSFVFIPADNRELFHFIFLALAAGVSEEIIFRGYLIHYLVFWTGNGLWGIVLACIISSLLFAFLHGYQGIQSMAKIFFFALIFSAIFVLSQSLLIVIIIHALVDIFSGIVGVQLLRSEERKAKSEE